RLRIVMNFYLIFFFFFSSRRRHTRSYGDWSSDVCSSDLSGDGFFEGDPVLGTIGACLTSAPFEAWAKFHLACSVTRGRAPEQCPKIQTGAPPPRTLNNGVRPVRIVTRA